MHHHAPLWSSPARKRRLSRTYQDPQKRFEFTYPAEFGAPSAGTDDGFRDRVAAIRFSEFSAGVRAGKIILGGEAVLTKESPQVDLQAAGGLYDGITLQVFPAPVAIDVRSALPRLTAANFCDAIARERHADPSDPRLSSLTAAQKTALAQVDQMGNACPEGPALRRFRRHRDLREKFRATIRLRRDPISAAAVLVVSA